MSNLLEDLGRGFRDPRIYLTLGVALVLWAAAYQHKREYTVQVADLGFHPYITGFNDIERSITDPPFDYRWSKSSPEIEFPGIGNQPVEVVLTTFGARPGGDPPLVVWTARGKEFELQTQPQLHTDTFFLDRGSDPLDGDLRLAFDVPTFTPRGDPRELGVIIRSVTVRPADYGLRPFVIPPLYVLLGLLAGLAGTYALFLISGLSRALALASTWLLAILSTLGILLARPDTALLAANLVSLMAWGLPLAVIARLALTRLLSSAGNPQSAIAWGTLAFALTFVVRFGGLTYPQFLTSDLLLHVHNAQEVMAGKWVFSEPLPDGRLVPYPPAYYLLIAGLSPLTGASDEGLGLAFKWTASLLDALTCLGLACAASRLWPRHGQLVGPFAALAYLASPGALDLFSAGNYTNLFGQSMLNLTLLGALVYISGRQPAGRWVPLLLAVGFLLTMLGHYSMLLATLVIMFFFAVSIAIFHRSDAHRKRSWAVLGAYGSAVVGGFALYYWRFLDVIAAQFGDVLGRLWGQRPVTTSASQAPGLRDSLLKLPGKVGQLLGGLLVISAGYGSALLSRRLGAVRALIFSWLAATLIFAVLDSFVGDSIRWYYLGAAPIALLAGRFLALLASRQRWCRPLAILTLSAALLHMLLFWIDLIYIRYH
jgi:hypothetical protein